MSSHDRELWFVYAHLGRIFRHWTTTADIMRRHEVDFRSGGETLPHQCSDQTCRPLGLDPRHDVIGSSIGNNNATATTSAGSNSTKKNLYVCDKTGRYHVCGKTFCNSAVGRRNQWTCEIMQHVFTPDMCVYQKDLIRQCVVFGDDHNPAFLHLAAFRPQVELDRQLHLFRQDYAAYAAPSASSSSRWTSVMPTPKDLEHFDQLFSVGVGGGGASSMPSANALSASIHAGTTTTDATPTARGGTDSINVTPTKALHDISVDDTRHHKLPEIKRVSTQKITGVKRTTERTGRSVGAKSVLFAKKAGAAAARAGPSGPQLQPSSLSLSLSIFPFAMTDMADVNGNDDEDDDDADKRRKIAHMSITDSVTTESVLPVGGMHASGVAAAVVAAAAAAAAAVPSTKRNGAQKNTPFRFPDMHLTEPCEEYAQEALHRIVHAATHRKSGRKKLRAVSLFRHELLQIDSNEHAQLRQLATQCWNSWTFLVPILTRTPALAGRWLGIYTLDIHCMLMLIASYTTSVQSFHWLNENNPNHPLLGKVCPKKKQLHELGITNDRLQEAMLCMHDISLYT